ncbi:MAG: hypothetical protein K6U04_06785 [Armatimonadetes bacterium]|nr:hypothetical protein [Armatimonadota bacterium]
MNKEQKKLIELRLTKCRLYLTEPELVSLLRHDPALWQEAIRRAQAARPPKQPGTKKLEI